MTTKQREVNAQLVPLAPVVRPAGSLRRRVHDVYRVAGMPVLMFLIFVAIWEFYVDFFRIPQYSLPSPSAIWMSFDSAAWAEIFPAARATAREALLGYVIGNTVGLTLAACMAEFRALEKSAYPYALFLNSLPMAVIAPLLIIWLGFSIWAIVAVSALMVFFPTLVTGVSGFKAADSTTLELMRGLNASRWKIFKSVKVPYALPFIFSALKIAVASALVGALIGEWISSDQGLGFLTVQANRYVDMLLLFRAIFAVAIFAITGFVTVSVLEWHFLKWRG